MMINRIYNTLKFFTNNQVQGNVTPTEYNVALYNRLLEKQERYFSELSRLTNRENRGLITQGHGDLPKKLIEKISHYLKNDKLNVITSTGLSGTDIKYTITVPDDCRYVDLLLNSANNRRIQNADSALHFHSIQNISHTAPTDTFPICLKVNSSYEILPGTVTSVKMYYLRNPLEPNWTYTVVDSKEVFNPSDNAFQDVDIHISEETDLTMMVLKSFGINLKEEQLVKIVSSEEFKKFNEENNL